MDVPLKQLLMSTVDMRTEVTTWLESIDDDFMAVVHAMVGTYVEKQSERKHELFDFSTEAYEEMLHKPLSKADLIARAEASNADIEAGRTYSMEEAKAELGL
jgi:hypothetical protein